MEARKVKQVMMHWVLWGSLMILVTKELNIFISWRAKFESLGLQERELKLKAPQEAQMFIELYAQWKHALEKSHQE